MSDTQRGFRRLPNGDVQLTMSRDDYERLVHALGFAAGAMSKSDSGFDLNSMLGLANRLLAGSPTFTPYSLLRPK